MSVSITTPGGVVVIATQVIAAENVQIVKFLLGTAEPSDANPLPVVLNTVALTALGSMFSSLATALEQVQSQRLVKDSTGVYSFDPDSCPHVLTYTGDKIITDTITTPAGDVFRQTLTYTSDNVTGISAWIRQV